MNVATVNRLCNQASFSEWLLAAIAKYENPVIISQGQSLTANALLTAVVKLRDRLALLADQVVLLEGQNESAFLIGLVALIDARAIVAPISPLISATEQNLVAQTLGASAIIRITNDPEDCSVELLAGLGKVNLPRSLATGPGFIRFTSGTTGTARGVCISADSAQARAMSAAQALSLTNADQVLFLVPIEQHFVAALLAFLVAGVSISIPKQNFIHAANKADDASILFATPADIRQLCLGQGLREVLPRLRLALATTGPISELDCNRFVASSGVPLSRVFGAIEVGLALGNIDGSSALPDSLGFPFPGYEIKICQGDNQGHLAFRGRGICSGYISSSTQDSLAFKDGWFITADIAEQLADGSYRIKGRSSSAINVSGYKVFPEEVEAAILQIPEVMEVRVLGLTDEKLGEVVGAQIVLKNETSLSDGEVIEFCRNRLIHYMVPTQIQFVSELPKTLSGKIQRWG